MVVVAGGTGYIGRHLSNSLAERGEAVRCLTRRPESWRVLGSGGVEAVRGDVLDPASLDIALAKADAAFYLVHNMGRQPLSKRRTAFEELELRGISNFITACRRNGVRRLIFLGGLGAESLAPSRHLRSRWGVEKAIHDSGMDYTVFRASIVVGRGCPAFNAMVGLAQRWPVIGLPTWRDARVQPVALSDMIRCLTCSLYLPQTVGRIFDVGCEEILTYREMIQIIAEQMGRHPRLFNLPCSAFLMSGLIVAWACRIPVPMAVALVSSMKADMVCRSRDWCSLIPGRPLTFRAAVREALRS